MQPHNNTTNNSPICLTDPRKHLRTRRDLALPARPLDVALLVGELLPAALVLVEGGKVVADDGYGQRDDEDAADGAHGPDHLAEPRHGHDVAVADLEKGDSQMQMSKRATFRSGWIRIELGTSRRT